MSDMCQRHELMEQNMKQLQEEKIAIVKGLHEVRERTIKNTERIDVANKRIKDLEDDSKALTDMVTSLKVLTTEIKHLVEKLDDHEGRLDSIERKPAMYWQTLITVLISGLVGYGISLL